MDAHRADLRRCPPGTVTLEHISKFREKVEREGLSARGASLHQDLARALVRRRSSEILQGVTRTRRLAFATSSPSAASPLERREAVRLVKAAWRAGYFGLAALIAVAWNSSLSPVDARTLTPSQRLRDAHGDVFTIERAKTGREAPGTLTAPRQPRAGRISGASRRRDPAERANLPQPVRPRLFQRHAWRRLPRRARDGVRAGRARTIADMRRSGTVEAMRGGASAEIIGNKLANDFATSSNLQRTYAPVDLARSGRPTRRDAAEERNEDKMRNSDFSPVSEDLERFS